MYCINVQLIIVHWLLVHWPLVHWPLVRTSRLVHRYRRCTFLLTIVCRRSGNSSRIYSSFAAALVSLYLINTKYEQYNIIPQHASEGLQLNLHSYHRYNISPRRYTYGKESLFLLWVFREKRYHK